MGIVAIDAGGSATKVYDGKALHVFPSTIGYDWRERRIEQRHGETDWEWSYEGMRGFAGSLAQNESDAADSLKGDTKATLDARLRVLLALHQFADGTEHQIIVGQPIGRYTATEKADIKQQLTGRHEIAVNGVRRVLVVRRCEVSAEGVTAGLLVAGSGTVRIIDIGSGTVNFGTLKDRRLVDRGSFTLSRGLETTTADDSAFAQAIIARAVQGGWQSGDDVYLCGGGASRLLAPVRGYFRGAQIITGDPVTANVRAYWLIARRVYA